MYQITADEREEITDSFNRLIQENAVLQAKLQQQQAATASDNNSLFLELLGVVDALDYLCGYLAENPEPPAAFQQRLPNSLRSIVNKLEDSLAGGGVKAIDVPLNTPADFKICAAVGREVRTDLEPQSVIKVSRRGFTAGKAVLRSAEVIIAVAE
jgi:molecular chaperone GrpE (heat shock protein)